MKLEIEITNPPPGYSEPIYGPVYLPAPDDLIVFVDQYWERAQIIVKRGGSYWIYCRREE